MGDVRVALRLANAEDGTLAVEVLDALVDTGATWTAAPRRLVEGLALRPAGSLTLRTASGPQSLEHTYARIELAGKSIVSHLLVSDTLDVVLVGVTTLEALGLAVDPVEGELRETELFLL